MIRSASHRKTNEIIFSFVRPFLSPDAVVADIGCGQGHMTRRFSTYFSGEGKDPASHVRACDVTGEQYEAHEVPFSAVDLNRGLPFAASSFDAMVSVEVLEHLQNVYALFEECFRCLKPGGILVFSVPSTVHMASRLSFLATGFFAMYLPPSTDLANAGRLCGHILPLNFAYYSYGLRRAGFQDVRFVPDRRKKSAIAAAVILYPLLALSSAYYRSKIRRYDAAVFAENREVLSVMNHFDMLTSRSCIVAARKPL
jgi:SAM-dependent methyltransferase